MNTPTITTAQVANFTAILTEDAATAQLVGIVVEGPLAFSMAYSCEASTETIVAAVEALGLDGRDIVRGSLSVTPDEVRWTQIARDLDGGLIVRNGKPVAFLRVVKVNREASGETPTPDPAV